MMRYIIVYMLCFLAGASHVFAQTGVEDSIRINLDVLRQLEQNTLIGAPSVDAEKPWMQFDETLPVLPQREDKPKVRLTLRPYTANTKYNWDPVYQKKIKVGKDTWRSDPFYALTRSPRKVVMGSQALVTTDLMAPFTREFWQFQHKKNRKRTLQLLKIY